METALRLRVPVLELPAELKGADALVMTVKAAVEELTAANKSKWESRKIVPPDTPSAGLNVSGAVVVAVKLPADFPSPLKLKSAGAVKPITPLLVLAEIFRDTCAGAVVESDPEEEAALVLSGIWVGAVSDKLPEDTPAALKESFAGAVMPILPVLDDALATIWI
jgi:hypothetical protein